MVTLRRYLSLLALLFWQGGFTFYAAVVIPIAGRVLHHDLHLRARITDEVTYWLNISGVVAILLLVWDLAASRDPSGRRFWSRGAAWAVLFVTLAALFPMHSWLELLDPLDGNGPTDPATFHTAHGLYLSISTVQWLAGLVAIGLALIAWRAEDAKAGFLQQDKQEIEKKGKKIPPLATSASPSHRSGHTAEQS
jgi:hypothetical protein